MKIHQTKIKGQLSTDRVENETVIYLKNYIKKADLEEQELADKPSTPGQFTFRRCVAFNTALQTIEHQAAGKVSATSLIINGTVQVSQLTRILGIFTKEPGVVQHKQIEKLNHICMYDRSTRKRQTCIVDGSFKSPARFSDFKLTSARSTLTVPVQVLQDLELFKKLWAEEDISLVTANVVTIYGMLSLLRETKNLTPYKDPAYDVGGYSLWKMGM